jgi:LPS-assembly protein
MKELRKFRSNYFFNGILAAAMLCTLTWKTAAYAVPAHGFYSLLTAGTDTMKPPGTTGNLKRFTYAGTDSTKLPDNDSTSVKQKVDTFSLKLSKDSLEAPLKYAAEDSVVVMIQDKKIYMYGKTRTDYKDISLTAPKVELDQQTQIVTAVNRKDSDGAVIETAHFKEKENEFSSDTIRYNFKSQKGLTQNTITKQNEFFVHGEQVKKVNDNVTYIRKALFTTCDLDDPHFAIQTNKMKIINNKLAISGPAHLEFEGVPIPIYLPFGFYPLSQGRHSGLLPPQFTTNDQFGLGLEGLGYYKVLSDYWDAKIYGNVYSYGGWSVNLNPTYRKRYRYSGAFNLSMQTTKINFKGDPDFSKTRTYFITWNHTSDSRSRPGTNFSASVNAGSTKYNRYLPYGSQLSNQTNTPLNFENQLGSSITYSKSWAGKPYNLTLSANHNQNNATHLINVSLPDAGFTVNTVYPFQRKELAGTPKWYEKLGIGYSGNFRNQVSFYDTAFKFKNLLDTLQWGAQHNIPITLSLPPVFGGALIIAPSLSYSQVWISQKFRLHWDTANKKLDTTVTKGFFTDQSAQASLNFSTAIFGTYQFKHSRILAIRHVIRPSLSINYKPDLSKSHYYTTQLDSTGYTTPQPLSEFQGALYQGYSLGKVGGIGFNLDNNLEMKWRSKKDTGENAIKKIKLIDGYGFSTAYNFFAKSFKLSPFQFHLNTNLFEKINISASATMDPYQADKRGNDTDVYTWKGGKFNLGRITNGSISISTSFKSKPKDPKKEEDRKQEVQDRLGDPSLVGDQQRLLDYMRQNPSEFVDFNVPWEVNLSYSLYFSQLPKPDYSGFTKVINSNVNFNGSFSLTPKWKFSTNGYYDFGTHKLQTFQMSINREMHCWQMSINVTPIGLYRSFSFTINPKASVLQDLKINRSRSFSSY